jgi:hypothetical protein
MSTPKSKKLKLILKKPETTCGTGTTEVYVGGDTKAGRKVRDYSK